MLGAAQPKALLGLTHRLSTRYPPAIPPAHPPAAYHPRHSAVKAWPTAPLESCSGVLGAAAVHALPHGVSACAMTAAPGLLALGTDDGRLQLLATERLGSTAALASSVQLDAESGALLACGMLGGGGGGGGSEHGSVLLYSTEARSP